MPSSVVSLWRGPRGVVSIAQGSDIRCCLPAARRPDRLSSRSHDHLNPAGFLQAVKPSVAFATFLRAQNPFTMLSNEW